MIDHTLVNNYDLRELPAVDRRLAVCVGASPAQPTRLRFTDAGRVHVLTVEHRYVVRWRAEYTMARVSLNGDEVTVHPCTSVNLNTKPTLDENALTTVARIVFVHRAGV